jgi:hypothetical protein
MEEEKDKKPPIEIRYKELEEQGLGKREIVKILHQEGYSTFEMMHTLHLPIQYIKEPKGETEEGIMRELGGPTSRNKGYLMELQDTFAHIIMKDKELTKSFYSMGIASLFAALQKSGLSMDDFRKIAADVPGKEGDVNKSAIEMALQRAGETIFKALEAYNADIIPKIEAERDEARFYASKLELQLEEINKKLEPRQSLENMIYKLAMLGGTNMNPAIITDLIDKWLQMQMPTIIEGV